MDRLYNKERLGLCVECNEEKIIINFRGKPTCLECLVREDPLTIDDFIYGDKGYGLLPEAYYFE